MTIGTRQLGASGIAVAPLVLGGNVFGWTADDATSFRILDEFVDAGGNMIDTADVYSAWVGGHRGGESEGVIGRWLKRDSGKRAQVLIATKVGLLGAKIVEGDYVSTLEPQVIANACEASLQRLGIDCIDLYYHHKDNPAVPLADSLGAMDRLVRAGKVRAVGLSQYPAERLDEAMQVAAHDGLVRPCALQTYYNMMERGRLEGALRDAATSHGLAILPFFGLANGFLTGKYRTRDDLNKSARGDRVADYLSGKGPKILTALDRVSDETGAPLAAVALAWTNAQPGISATLASATSLDQLSELTQSMRLSLTAEQLAVLTDASA